MPTGYTYPLVEKQQSFPDFALSCARAFGALIMMRDDPEDAPIPDKFEPSDYHVKRIAEATAELARLKAMNDEEKIAFGKSKRAAEIESHKKGLEKNEDENAVFVSMEREVLSWTPPTSEHQGLKDFMLQQLKTSKHDTSYVENLIKEVSAKPPIAFYSEAVLGAERDIEYNTEHNAKEIERTNGRTEWVRALRESLMTSVSPNK